MVAVSLVVNVAHCRKPRVTPLHNVLECVWTPGSALSLSITLAARDVTAFVVTSVMLSLSVMVVMECAGTAV